MKNTNARNTNAKNDTVNTKTVTRIKRGTHGHWVGDGFPVSTMFSYADDAAGVSPFLLMDYAGPADFEPADKPRGVEIHPHRGFETVTIVYQGEVEHKDNAGNAGKIGPGDVQWMTAARGILHEEMHGREFTQKGGTLEMIQLWVNLPAKDKMGEPGYQEILNAHIPQVPLPGNAGFIRLIAGEYGDTRGAARTHTPVDLWDMRLRGGTAVDLPIPAGRNAMLLVLTGGVDVNGTETLSTRELAHLSPEGGTLSLTIREDTTALLLSGERIDEPVVGRGPFVMNTADEIKTAMVDYAMGRF